MVLNEKNEEEKDNILTFEQKPKLLKFEPSVPPGGDWLTPLPEGTIFLVISKMRKPNRFLLGEFTKTNQFDKAVQIWSNVNGEGQMIIVCPVEFCKEYDLYEIMKSGEEEPEEKNDERNRPNQD